MLLLWITIFFQVVLYTDVLIMCFFLLILQKLGHRLSALSKTTWSEQTKDEIKRVLTVEYTSSDESSYEPDSDSEVPQLQSYKVKHLKWERTRLTNVKQTLDNIYLKSLPRRIRQSLVPRVSHLQESERKIPLIVIDWAVRQSAPARRPVPMPRQSLASGSPAGSEASSSLSTTFEDRVLDPVLASTPRCTRQC